MRGLKVTVHLFVRTNQVCPVHSVDGVQDPVECHPEITDMPQPTEDLCDVLVAIAEAEDGEEYGKDRTNENCHLDR